MLYTRARLTVHQLKYRKRMPEIIFPLTIAQACNAYLDSLLLSRSSNTARTYRNGLSIFLHTISEYGLDADTTEVNKLPEDAIVWLANALKDSAPTTERLYLTATIGFYEFLAGQKINQVNLPRVRLLVKQRARRPGQRLPQFPRDSIETVLAYAETLASVPVEDDIHRLRNLRDRAFLVTLADTGLRVHEACKLRRGDIDWNEGRAMIIGKGDKQDIVRFSNRAIRVLRDYLTNRAGLDRSSGRPLPSLALFARHDRGAGKKIKPITTATGRNIVAQRVYEALGSEYTGSITPHSFRHYFVTTVLRASGNLKLAQELARHSNIAVTQRYAHLSDDELDRGYYEIFDQHTARK
jgi:integrase/recombinase XerC